MALQRGAVCPVPQEEQTMADGRAVVFGGTGFLGRRIMARLERMGIAAVAASRHRPNRDGEHVAADVTDPASIERAVVGAAVVVNCVSLYVEAGDATFKAIHVGGACNLARATARSNARLIHISGIGADQSSASPYVRARGEGEVAVREAMPEAVIVRPSIMFGPGDAFVSTIARLSRSLPVLPLFGTGATRMQPVHVEDVAAGVLVAMERAEATGVTFELGGAEIMTYREVIRRVAGWCEARPLLVPFPLFGWRLLAGAARLWPTPPITEGQVALMRHDNVVSGDAAGLVDLGVTATVMTREAAFGEVPAASP
jgi:NADH dehydrogenase